MNLSPPPSRSAQYSQLLQKKKRFLIPLIVFSLAFYFSLPVFISLVPHWMNLPVYGSITLAWIFAVSQCVMTLFLSTVYVWKARQFDRMVQKIACSQESEAEQ